MERMRIVKEVYGKLLGTLLFVVVSATGWGQLVYSDKFGGVSEDLFTIAAKPDCEGYVEFELYGERTINSITFTLDSPNNSLGTGSITYSGPFEDTTFNLHFNTVNQSAWIQVAINYQGPLGGTHNEVSILHYSRPTSTTDVLFVDYEVVELSPNYMEFTYTGMNAPGPEHYYVFNFGDGGGVWSDDGLINGENIGVGWEYQAANPHFYCKDEDVGLQVLTALQVWRSYTAYLYPDEGVNALNCLSDTMKVINLDNLCSYLSEPTISPGINEFKPKITTSSVAGTGLEDFVTNHTLNVDYDPGEGGQPVGFDEVHTANYGSEHGSYTINEYVEFQGGCGCNLETVYNTDNPCMNMSSIGIERNLVEGEYEYTITPATYEGSATNVPAITSITINFGDGSSAPVAPGSTVSHVYTSEGPFTITQTTTYSGVSPPCETTRVIAPDMYCCTNFSLDDDTDAYWVSAWVKEDHPTQQMTYTGSAVEIEFTGGLPETVVFQPTGDLVEGWQRIVGKFTVPSDATGMQIHLVSSGTVDSYFDDVRIHPFNASMKSYVYDPQTLWLTAELDDNNYATIYEYDTQGQLVRIKKETSRGIMTIQESRSSNKMIEE